MNEWKNSFTNKAQQERCYCTDDRGLFVPNRQLSALIAGLLFLLFGFFMAGYFMGKRSSIEQFTIKMNRESEIDKSHLSLITENTSNNNDEAPLSPAVTTDALVSAEQLLEKADEIASAVESHQYYAQLIGFVTEKAAQKFVQKLALRNIETIVKKRVSKTAKGRTVYWYQVITSPYTNKEQLMALVTTLEKEEKLRGVTIEVC